MAYIHLPTSFLLYIYTFSLLRPSWLRHFLSVPTLTAVLCPRSFSTLSYSSTNPNDPSGNKCRYFSPLSLIMTCGTPSITIESYENLSLGQSSGTPSLRQPLNPRRRHSSYHSLRRRSQDLNADATFVKARFFPSRRTEVAMLIYR